MSRLATLGFTALLAISLLTCSACQQDDNGGTSGNEPDVPEVSIPETDGGDDTSTDDSDADETSATTGDEDPVASTDDPGPEATQTLTIGDVAPALAIGDWVKGEPVSTFTPGHVYVVEFWATWCGPCRLSMPHLSELQADYDGRATIIGVSNEGREIVDDFMTQTQNQDAGTTWDEAVTYTVALDSEDAMTTNNYMRAAQQSGIPTAFIVGPDGHVEWIGHPMRMDEPLEKVVAGQWDRTAAKVDFESRIALKSITREVAMALSEAKKAGEYGSVFAILDRASSEGIDPALLDGVRLEVHLQASQFEEAVRFADEYASRHWDDANELNEIAWKLATRIESEYQDLPLAMKIAIRASELTGDQNASILDTIARIEYEGGNLDSAIEWQQRAVESNVGDARISRTLERYLAEKEGGGT